MAIKGVSFDKIINGFRYMVVMYEAEDVKRWTTVNADILNRAPSVYSVRFNEETQTFEMTDFLDIFGRRVKIMFNLDLKLNIVGFVYNDLSEGYDMINPLDYFREDCICDTAYVYKCYKDGLKNRLAEILLKQESKYSEENSKMLALNTKKDN